MGLRRRKLRGVDQPLVRIGHGGDESEIGWNSSCISSFGEEHERGAEALLREVAKVGYVLLLGVDEKDAALGRPFLPSLRGLGQCFVGIMIL